MLATIVRALFVFVVLCLVTAVRPAPRPIYHDPMEARLDVAKSHVELAAPRRDGESRDPREQRALALGLPAAPFVLAPPLHVAPVAPQRASSHAVVPVISARSSRGPPVGSAAQI